MTPEQIKVLTNLGFVLLVVVIIALIWFIIWTAIWIPIRKKDNLLKERDEARLDLIEIQAAKGVEWDKYKELEDENDRMRKAYFKNKEDLDKIKEEKAKLQVDKENLINFNRELKKQQQETKEKDTK